jgi:hypothetical protein
MEDVPSRKTAERVYIVSLLIIGLGLMVFGVLLEIKSVRLYTNAKESLSWPTTEGEVISSKIETYGGLEKTSHKARVVYKYLVNGTNYSSESVSLEAIDHDDYFYAAQVVRQYHVGKSVTVYYKPGNPEVALLELTEGPYISLVAVIFFLVIGLFILIYGILEYQSLTYDQSKPQNGVTLQAMINDCDPAF